MEDPGGRSPDSQRQNTLALVMMGLLGQVGCVTLVIIVAALSVGLWLDKQFSTRPIFTLILTLGSLPVTLYLMVRIVLGGMGRLQQAANALKGPDQEADRAGDSGANP